MWIDRVLLRVILPQIAQITQRNAAGLHYIAEKDSLFNVVLWFVCVNLRDLRENRPFTHTKNYVDEYKNNNNGRSRVSRGNKIQKLRKFA